MVETKTEAFLKKRGVTPVASEHMSKMVSQYRREVMEEEVGQGLYKEKGSSGYNLPSGFNENIKTVAGNVLSSSSGFKKYAATASPGSGAGVGAGSYRGSGGTMRQIPEIYSPLWLTSNLNLPRDRATINAWCRAYFALNPIVHNAISLHSTYPISKLNIKCKNEKVQAFFEDMIEEIDLMNICIQIAQEYWLLGEAFVYAELDERSAKWSRLLIQNPDYMVVKHSVVAGEPILSLRPDENLKRIVTSNKPSDLLQKQKLDPSIVEHVRKGENIPLSNLYASHLARRISPYETRGTGLPVSSFRVLMLLDMLRECHDEETEVLTNQGFKKFNEVIEFSEALDGTYNIPIISHARPVNGIKIACFNPDTECLEYHEALNAHVSNYEGEMHHYTGEKVDICVTPDHDMWVKKKSKKWSGWYKEKSKNIIDKGNWFKLRSICNFKGKAIKNVSIGTKTVPIEDYLEFLGYLISDGGVYINEDKNYNRSTYLVQTTKSIYIDNMQKCINKIGGYLGKNVCNNIRSASTFLSPEPTESWEGRIHGKDVAMHFINEMSDEDGRYTSHFKRLPRWVLSLNKKLLKILLNALLAGDGSKKYSEYNDTTKSFSYSTASKQLADDVYELVFKLGYSPNICISKKQTDFGKGLKDITEYRVMWSNTVYGEMPNVLPNLKKKGNGGGAKIERINYSGKVWCFEVPTGLFITRRHNKITIQGNSKFSQASDMVNPLTLIKIGGGPENYKPTPADLEAWREVFEAGTYDKNFKIFTHDAVAVEKVGSNSAIIDISNDVTQLMKELYIGLMIPQVLMDGGSDVTYANGGVTLDVLRQRYMHFRNMLSAWLRKKIFAPIAKINEFYEKKDGQHILVVPEVEWNHMSLFDAGDYIQTLVSLSQDTGEGPKKVSMQTVYRSLGLDWEDETRKIKIENIQNAINEKEMAALSTMSLNDLRAIGPDDPIDEQPGQPLPGETGATEEGGLGDMTELPGVSPGPMPEAPPPPQAAPPAPPPAG